ncbi:Tetratricopeptide-like helical [Penicillium cataractarum]|uniref:Mitochondrial division protein 1 n=1 Tax=Penicillium cataractarum TaxID=2100454 RepID=A0A9W9VFK7_9EURO|nr:Tetratricopeptide-like helical [Penicillium cataractarum]KAJ5380112.1 Tetratricopeptide-like helical [Penicillium cataractarum]
MAMLPDLVQDFKLTTHFRGEETIHTYQESDPTSGNRLISRTEHWKRHKKIGNGAYGSVWLENCTKGRRNGSRVRAVKQSHLDSRSGPVDYTRELESRHDIPSRLDDLSRLDNLSRSTQSSSWHGRLHRRDDKIQAGFKDWVSRIAFSPDGKTLAAGSGNEISICSPAEHNRKILVQDKTVREFAFSPDGKYLASGSNDTYFSLRHDIHLWDLNKLTEVTKFTIFTAYPSCMWDSAGNVSVWALPGGFLNRTDRRKLYHTFREKLLGLTFLPSGELLLVDSKGIYHWNRITKVFHHRRIDFHGELKTRQVRFSAQGAFFFYRVSGTYKIEFCFIDDGLIFRTFDYTLRDKILCMNISPNGQFLAATVYNGKHNGSRIVIWDALDGTELDVVLTAHSRKAEALAFSPHSRFLATGCHGGILKTWYWDHTRVIAQVERREDALSHKGEHDA